MKNRISHVAKKDLGHSIALVFIPDLKGSIRLRLEVAIYLGIWAKLSRLSLHCSELTIFHHSS
jgi:hypothetical protein